MQSRSQNIIFAKLKFAGLVNPDQTISDEVIEVIQKINSKHPQSKNKAPITLASIHPAIDAKDEKASIQIQLKSQADAQVISLGAPSKLNLLEILRINSKKDHKSYSIYGAQISSYLTDADHKSLVNTARDFRQTIQSAHTYRVEWALKTYNAMPIWIETRRHPCVENGYQDAGRLVEKDLELECVRQGGKSSVTAICTPILGAIGVVEIPFVTLLCNPLQFCFCPNDQYMVPCADSPKYCAGACYCLLCGPCIKSVLQNVSCVGAYTAGAIADKCCNGIRTPDPNNHIAVMPPTAARLFTQKGALLDIAREYPQAPPSCKME